MRSDILVATLAAAAAGACLLPGEARACGPDFPIDFFSDRDRTMLDLPEGAFAAEAARLVPSPADRFTAVEGGEPDRVRERGGERERALYEAGAAAFRQRRFGAAEAAFAGLLALPAGERHHRTTWAAYMMGRIGALGRRGNQEAAAAFALVRDSARAGFADELGLAVASLGEEAHLRLEAGDDVGAIRLYAEQAAHRSASGVASLGFVARAVVADPARLGRVVADSVGQKLVAVYLYARSDEMEPGEIERALDLIERVTRDSGTDGGMAGADRLAAAAYRAGRWALAERAARLDPASPLSAWVLGKLALRAGDRATARAELDRAAAGLLPGARRTPIDNAVALSPRARVDAERGILALTEDRFVDAMEHAWSCCADLPDAAHVAERVLTVDELMAFVDRHAPTAIAARDRIGAKLGDPPTAPALQEAPLRALLARRLMRSGRYDEALRYFAPGEERRSAEAFGRAMRRARAAADPVDVAESLFAAARLARAQGLELLGMESDPDWAIYDGQYDGAGWQSILDDGEELASPARRDRAVPAASDPWATDGERARVRASAPAAPARFHYRWLASRLAEEAAAAVPPRSQAFAALLCHSARYVFFRDPPRVAALWRRYVKQAAASVPLTFGQECPAPDFGKLREQLRAQARAAIRPWLVAALVALAGAAALVFVACLRARLRQRSSVAGSPP